MHKSFSERDKKNSGLTNTAAHLMQKLKPGYSKNKGESKKFNQTLNDICSEEETHFLRNENEIIVENLEPKFESNLNIEKTNLEEFKFKENILSSYDQAECEMFNFDNNSLSTLKSNIMNNAEDINENRSQEGDSNAIKKDTKKNENKKTIQFDFGNDENKLKENVNFISRRPSSNVHEKLNQLKVDAIKRSKLKESMPSLEDAKESKLFDFEKLKDLIFKTIFTKSSVYYLLERPIGNKGFFYRLFTLMIILCSIVTGALTTIQSLDRWSSIFLFNFEIFTTAYFAVELALRIWSVGHRADYNGIQGRIKYITRPIPFIELLVLILSVIFLSTFSVHVNNAAYILKTNALTIFRFVQILRILYIDRQAKTWTLLMKVIFKHRFELLTSVYIGVIILLFSSYLILIFEKPYSQSADDNHFQSFADAVYWSIITMTTIGYGDRSPRTFCGKIVATCLCIVGVAFWTLPGGIIGSGFALKVEQKNKKKQFNRLLPAAASLIQAWWRMKATFSISPSNTSCLIATVNTFDISKPIVSPSLRRFKKNLDLTYKLEASNLFWGLDSPNANQTSSCSQPSKLFMSKIGIKDSFIEGIKEENKFPGLEDYEQNKPINNGLNNTNELNSNSLNGATANSNEESSILLQLSSEHLILIRTILLLKYFTVKNKFKLAFKPYDFKDVIEQYTQGNMDILLKMKDLQRKIEQLAAFAVNFRNSPQYHSQHSNDSLSADKNSKLSNIANVQNSPSLNHKINYSIQKSSTNPAANSKSHFQNSNQTQHLRQNSKNIKITINDEKNQTEISKETNFEQIFSERICKLETYMEKVNSKLDLLLSLSTNRASTEDIKSSADY